MPISEIKISMKEYKRLVEEDAKKAGKQSYKALVTALSDIVPKMVNSSIRNILETNPDFALNLQQIQKVYGKADSQHTMCGMAGISNKCRLDQRNSAMSDIAALLGMSGIVAKSIPMNIINDGQVIEGTFMEKAIGEDMNHLNQDSLMLQADKDSFNNPAGLKQLADLQILDYICGNVDRHAGNIMYQFEKNKEGKIVLTGICGIDNDASFGTKVFTEERGGNKITPLLLLRI